jgi:hypothetical protein
MQALQSHFNKQKKKIIRQRNNQHNVPSLERADSQPRSIINKRENSGIQNQKSSGREPKQKHEEM